MKRILIGIILLASFSLHATAPPRGGEHLRELVVFPQLNFTLGWKINCQNNEWVVGNLNPDLPAAIAGQREKLRRQPDDLPQIMRLAYWLNQAGETNAAQICYQKAEQLCRNKKAVNPRDGLNLTALGAALDAQGRETEAESDFRRAVLVSSNEWKCWAGLGNFLENDAFSSMFSKDLRNAVVPGQLPSPAVLEYRPAPETLKKSEARCHEASRCFDRARQLAPKEPEMFVQRAGYMSTSNLQSCYLRHYRDNEKITTNEWLSACFSEATIANLRKASEFSPTNCQFISLAAYFEWCRVKLQNPGVKLDPGTLPSAPRRLILEAMTRLENLSTGADKKNAAEAAQSHGILSLMFQNLPAATADFRRAVALDPTREQSWNLLLGMLLDSATPDELQSVAEAQLKARNSARNHVILGKVLAQKMNKWSEAVQQAQIAAQMDANSAVPPLLLAAIALKQGSQKPHLADAKINLEHAYALLKKTPPDKDTFERLRELMLDGAIFNLFIDRPQSARTLVDQVLKHFPDDPTAVELLKNINARTAG